MKKFLALLLVAVMVLCFVACDDDNDNASTTTAGGVVTTEGTTTGNNNNTTTENNTTTTPAVTTQAPPVTGNTATNPDNSLVGSWKGSFAIGDMLESVYNEMFGDYFDFDDITLDIVYTFTEDTLTISADEDSVEAMVEPLVEGLYNGLKAYAAAEGEDLGMTDEELYDYCEENLDVDSLVESFQAETGYYAVVDGKLYSGEDAEELEDEIAEGENYEVIEVSGNVLTVTDMVEDGESINDYYPDLLPLTLNKQ